MNCRGGKASFEAVGLKIAMRNNITENVRVIQRERERENEREKERDRKIEREIERERETNILAPTVPVTHLSSEFQAKPVWGILFHKKVYVQLLAGKGFNMRVHPCRNSNPKNIACKC